MVPLVSYEKRHLQGKHDYFLKTKSKAFSTLSVFEPSVRISEFELRISVIINTKSEYPLLLIESVIASSISS